MIYKGFNVTPSVENLKELDKIFNDKEKWTSKN